MQMRMMKEILTPGVQHGKEAELSAQMFRISSDEAQGLGRGPEEDAIEHPFVLVGDSGNLFRYREDHVKVLRLQDLSETVLDPVSPRSDWHFGQ